MMHQRTNAHSSLIAAALLCSALRLAAVAYAAFGFVRGTAATPQHSDWSVRLRAVLSSMRQVSGSVCVCMCCVCAYVCEWAPVYLSAVLGSSVWAAAAAVDFRPVAAVPE